MNARKPTAASYARASYARELQGDRAGAIRLMQLSTEATPASDPESQAWHHAQLGYLLLDAGRVADAGSHLFENRGDTLATADARESPAADRHFVGYGVRTTQHYLVASAGTALRDCSNADTARRSCSR